jgi:histone H3/H4
MTSVALAASGATASETSGTKAACEAGGAVTPTVAAASEAERLMVAATEDSVVVASEAERPVVAPEDPVAVASEAERLMVAATEDSVVVASEAERPVVAPEDLVVVASEAEAEAATAVDTARSISSHSKQAAGNFQPLFSFVFGFLQLYRFPKSFMPGNQLRIDCSAPATGGKEPKTVIQVWCRKKVRAIKQVVRLARSRN